MRSALVLVLVAVLAAACAKKQAPTGVKSPAPDPQESEKATGGAADEADKDSAPMAAPPARDPCEGGESRTKP